MKKNTTLVKLQELSKLAYKKVYYQVLINIQETSTKKFTEYKQPKPQPILRYSFSKAVALNKSYNYIYNLKQEISKVVSFREKINNQK